MHVDRSLIANPRRRYGPSPFSRNLRAKKGKPYFLKNEPAGIFFGRVRRHHPAHLGALAHPIMTLIHRKPPSPR